MRQSRPSSSARVEHRESGETVREHTDNSQPVVHETGRRIVGDRAYVRIEGSVTQGLANYSSVRVGVSYEMPCEPNLDAMDEMADTLSGLVDVRLRREMALATGVEEAEETND